MSTDRTDSASPQGSSQEPQPAACKCCCRGHRKLYAALFLILLIAAGGSWIALRQIGGKLRSTEPYQAAMAKIRADPTLRDALGQPINDAWRTAGEPEDMYFDIQGPKGSAKVHARARRAQGKWELIQLEVTLQATDKKVLVPLDGENDAPPADFAKPPADNPPPAAPTDAAKPSANGPAPEIKIDLPSPPGGEPGKS